MLGVVGYFFAILESSGQIPPIPKAHPLKQKRSRVEITQGAGAMALISKAPLVQQLPAQVFYFAATATDVQGLESEFSVEVSYTNAATPRATRLTLAWDPSPSTNIIANYKVYRGLASRAYTSNFSAGTNLTIEIPLYPPPLTNIVVTVVCTNGGVNILWSRSLAGPWSSLNTTNYSGTNLSSPRFYRGMGSAGNRVLITTRRN